MEPTVCGVGYNSGEHLTTEPNGSRKPYSTWKNMIYRCYDESNPAYKFYGGRGVTVSEEWLDYDKFREDLINLPGYDEHLFYSNKLQLDKDGLDSDIKLYSKDTCQLISHQENIDLVDWSSKKVPPSKTRVLGLSPEGAVHYIVDVPLFSESLGVLPSDIYGAMGVIREEPYGGWLYKKVEDITQECNIVKEEMVKKRAPRIYNYYEINTPGEDTIYKANAKEAADYVGCSQSLVGQRTIRGGKFEYRGYQVSRLSREEYKKKERGKIYE